MTRALILVFVFFGFLNACTRREAKVVFRADSELVGLLPGLSTADKPIAVALPALTALDEKRKQWCASPSAQSGLARDLTNAEKAALNRDDYKMRAVLGCGAWFQMTDKTPEIDLAYARNKVDSNLSLPLHCISVGFVQPYIMGTRLNCELLTVVDISFRTMRLHAILMPLLTAPDFHGIDAALSLFEEQSGVKVAEICGEYSLVHCKIYFMAFAERYRGRLNAVLNLTALHRFQPGTPDLKQVVFMSNAPDPNFMNAEEFTELRKNLGSLAQPVFAIYHQAESSHFGVYELAQGHVTKICADNFVVSQSGRYSKDRCTYYPPSRSSYSNYFDNAAVNADEKLPCKF